jgi:hypothetical protein
MEPMKLDGKQQVNPKAAPSQVNPPKMNPQA